MMEQEKFKNNKMKDRKRRTRRKTVEFLLLSLELSALLKVRNFV
jgi:hypothetical protein